MKTIQDIVKECEEKTRNDISIGIGKIILQSQDTEFYNIPHLHFLLVKDCDGNIAAENLEFGLVSSDKQAENAVKWLAEMLIDFIHKNIEVFGFDTLTQLATTDALDDVWREYRRLEFALAKEKRDLEHAFVNEITKKVYRDIFNKYGIKATAKYNTLKKVA